tara:strand:+ start:249 stop:1319 length:1071 start_codon:yes stop_codon:yes gene_type:complete
MQEKLPMLLSVVLVVRNDARILQRILSQANEILQVYAEDYEIIVIDNGSTDDTKYELSKITQYHGLPNVQAYILAEKVEEISARWIGFENSIGDFIISIEPEIEQLNYLQKFVEKIKNGCDLILVNTNKSLVGQRANKNKRNKILSKFTLYMFLQWLIRISTGLKINQYSKINIGLNQKIINYLMQFTDPQIKLRSLSSLTGFDAVVLNMPLEKKESKTYNLYESMQRGISLVTSLSNSPLRAATILAAFSALMSFFYSLYVLIIWILKEEYVPGWYSLSLQQATMFFFISLVLLVMSEYLLEISRKSTNMPRGYIAHEFCSKEAFRNDRLNVKSRNFVKQNNNDIDNSLSDLFND